jgi:hypothetical protein
MKRLVALPLFFLLYSGCSSTKPVSPYYENDDLVAVQYNTETAYTLLIYQDQEGQTRHVLRKRGVCELVITYSGADDIALKERGAPERKITVAEAFQVTKFINSRLRNESEGKGKKKPQNSRSIEP